MVAFDHEKLNVYQEAIRFVAWADELIQSVTRGLAAKDQLDRASTSIPLNIAEGNGKFSIRDRCRFLSTAYGSALECAACLDVLVAKKAAALEVVGPGKDMLKNIVSMLVGLMGSLSNRVAEDSAEYVVAREYLYERE